MAESECSACVFPRSIQSNVSALTQGSVWWKVSSIRLLGSDGAINASPPSSGRNHISCDNHGSETRVAYLHRGNPRRFSLNIPNKTVGLKLKKDQP